MNRKGIMTVLLAGCMVVSAGCGKDAESKNSISNEYVKVSQYKGIEIEKVEKEEVTDDFAVYGVSACGKYERGNGQGTPRGGYRTVQLHWKVKVYGRSF